MKRIAVEGLPTDPLAAWGVFLQHWLHHVETTLEGGNDVILEFAPADHTHREWRHAVTAGLARMHAPRRVNAVAGDTASLDAIADFLTQAPGVTGQYLEGDGAGAGNPAG